MIDAHVHFWDPRRLTYPWLDGLPALRRPFLPVDCVLSNASGMLVVESNVEPHQAVDEVRFVEELARAGAPIVGIVAFADLTDRASLSSVLDALGRSPLVRGVRYNIQGNPPGFAVTNDFVHGVRDVGERGFTFDLCVTHDQLEEAAELVRRVPHTRFVLDHCGKPAIRDGKIDPWRRDIARLAAEHNVVACKVSGLLTEGAPACDANDLLPYIEAAVAAFGESRVMYGSDWPVVTLAGGGAAWYDLTRRATADWTADARRGFYEDNAVRVYAL